MFVDLCTRNAYNGLMENEMTAQEFRSEMILRVRQFDAWSYKDQLENPGDYVGYTFEDWFELFKEYDHD